MAGNNSDCQFIFTCVFFVLFLSNRYQNIIPPVWMVIFDEWSEHERAFNQNSISITSEPCDVSWHWMKHPFAVFFLPIRTENWFAGNGLPFNWCILWKCSRLYVMCIIRLVRKSDCICEQYKSFSHGCCSKTFLAVINCQLHVILSLRMVATCFVRFI